MDVKEEILTCPYDKNHRVRCTRFKFHIIKCQQRHPDVPIHVCPYSANHRFTQYENFKKHLTDGCSKAVPSDTFYLFGKEYIKSGNIPPILPDPRNSFSSSQPSSSEEEWKTPCEDLGAVPCRVDQFASSSDSDDDYFTDNGEFSFSAGRGTNISHLSTSPKYSRPGGLTNIIQTTGTTLEDTVSALRVSEVNGGELKMNGDVPEVNKRLSEVNEGKHKVIYGIGRGSRLVTKSESRNPGGLRTNTEKTETTLEDTISATRISEINGGELKINGNVPEVNGSISEVNEGKRKAIYGIGRGSRSLMKSESRNPSGLGTNTEKELSGGNAFLAAIMKCQVSEDLNDNENKPEVSYSFGRGKIEKIEHLNPQGLKYSAKILKSMRENVGACQPSCSTCSISAPAKCSRVPYQVIPG